MKSITMKDIAEKRLAWAKQLQKENEKLEAEVKRLRMMNKALISQLTDAKQLMNIAVRNALDTSGTCWACDELDIIFEDFIPEGLRGKMLLDRQDPTSIYFVGSGEK